ncbi:signal transduction histidine kinase [Neobacillus niacini]|uniref:sensor histidine kinase n=1 Tax=Neobacillus driksii TaxID=3035913 RepID=UPI0027830F0F|nr:HAMP domain-containing sensor histidine kinase [Neobacillus niacini]MDQ0971005.1 signal transduction histidine kinase [Neobacillus niacini]
MLGTYITILSVGLLFIAFVISYIIFRHVLLKKQKENEENYREMTEKYEVVVKNLESRVAEEAAKNRQKDHFLLHHSIVSMGEMISSIGYQWQQPLNSLSLLIQDVREALQFGEINDHYIDTFTKEGMFEINFMSRTINDFRKFYQPTKQKCTFSISDCIEKALSICSYSLKIHDIHVEFEYREEHMAYGFPNEYSQAVLTLLTNARYAFITNKVNKRILDIKISAEGSCIVVDFTDNAGVIEPLMLSRVFEPDLTTRNSDTTGIGLYMTKIMIENMDGSVTVKNTGEGAQFRLSVPKAAPMDIPSPV